MNHTPINCHLENDELKLVKVQIIFIDKHKMKSINLQEFIYLFNRVSG